MTTKHLSQQQPAAATPVIITDVSVVSVTTGEAVAHRSVVCQDGRISAVGPTAAIEAPRDAITIDGSGRYVVPGLWDMHVHVFSEDRLPVFLGNGVTGIRHMAGAPVHGQWRDRLLAHDGLLAPRMAVAGRIIDGPRPLRPHSIAMSVDDDPAEIVRTCLDEGADFLKVYNLLPREAYFALAEEAAVRGVPFVGHVPFSVTVEEAAAAGQGSIEHLEGVLLGASTARAELIAEIAGIDMSDLAAAGRVFSEVLPKAAASYDADLAAGVYDAFLTNGTWQVPTLTVLQAIATTGTEEFSVRPYLPYIEPMLRPAWHGAAEMTVEDETRRFNAEVFERQLQVVGELHRAGVPLLAGTDTFVPGFALHDELGLLVRAGLSPAAALRTATLDAARFLNVADDFGTVEPGKVADLVVLDADPLTDIAATRGVFAVLSGGRVFDAGELERMRTPAPDAEPTVD